MRHFGAVAVLLSFLAGCGPPPPALRPGDEVRPEVAVAPDAPWPADARVALGMLLQVHRPGREVTYLADGDVPDAAAMQARVTFFAGDAALGEPLELPFVRDC